MRAWVYKVNSQGGERWHFDRYFRARTLRVHDMGGREWIRSPMSWQRLRRVRRGDLFVCYQTDERKIYGLACTASAGYESLPGSGVFDSVDFAAPKSGGALRLKSPVDVSRAPARQVFQHIRAFTVPSRGTIHALAADEMRALLGALIAANPEQKSEILAFAKGRKSH